MIDIRKDDLLSLTQAAREVPGGGVSMFTICRWGTRGKNGVKLETVTIGRRKFTTHDALFTFLELTGSQPGSNGDNSKKSRTRAARVLDRKGVR